jgi:hypothetical protein
VKKENGMKGNFFFFTHSGLESQWVFGAFCSLPQQVEPGLLVWKPQRALSPMVKPYQVLELMQVHPIEPNKKKRRMKLDSHINLKKMMKKGIKKLLLVIAILNFPNEETYLQPQLLCLKT